MKRIDRSYQAAVDREAEKVLGLSIEDFLKFESYGSLETSIDNKKVSIGFWHHKLGDTIHHIVFEADRRAFLFLYKKYLSGVKLANGTIERLSEKEIADYD